MPKIILLLTLIISIVFSLVVAKQYKKLVMKLIYMLLLTSTALIANIVVFSIKDFGDYLMYFVGVNLATYLIYILMIKKYKSNVNKTLLDVYMKDVINLIVIVLVFNFAWYFVIEFFSSTNYIVQTLYVILFMGIYTIMQLVFRKKLSHGLTLLAYSIVVGSLVFIGTVSNIIDSYGSTYNFYFGRYREAYFDLENTIIDRKLVLEDSNIFEFDSETQAVIIDEYIYYVEKDVEFELHRFDIASSLDEVILTSPTSNNNDDFYMDLVYEEFEDIIFVTTYDSLYLIDNNEISVLYSREIDSNAKQYIDYYSALYKEIYGTWYLGEDIIYYETESNRYIFDKESKVLVDDTLNWDSNELIYYVSEDCNLDFMFKLSVDFYERQILIGESNYVLSKYSSEAYDNSTSYVDLVDSEITDMEKGYDISAKSYVWDKAMITFQGEEFVKEIIDNEYYYSNTSINKIFSKYETDWSGIYLLKPIEIDNQLYIEYVNRVYDEEDRASFNVSIEYNIYSLSDYSYSTYFTEDNTYYMVCAFLVFIPIYNNKKSNESCRKVL